MKALLVYDSAFGNTKQVATKILQSLKEKIEIEACHVYDFDIAKLNGIQLLLVCSPTRGFQPTDAMTQMLKSLPDGCLNGISCIAFDTRLKADDINTAMLRFIIKKGGYAAKSIIKHLKKKGGEILAQPEGFYVKNERGPLKQGELERAGEWAKSITILLKAEETISV